jgi:DNA-binding transcriptional MerR regulator
MKEYTVKQLAQLAGVSVKTLHYYDRIGLLKPQRRSEKNYRYYGRKELLLLQQIMFYRKLQFSLQQIAEIIQDPEFDLLSALEEHQHTLADQARQLEQLLNTIEKTIDHLKNNQIMLKDEELYQGFPPEDVEPMRAEVRQRWGKDQLEAVESRLKALDKQEWEDHQQRGEAINRLLADLMELGPDHHLVHEAISQHHQYLNFFYEVDEERYRALGVMYIQDDRFKAFYEQVAPGLAEFLCAAIQAYCDRMES